MVTATRNNQYRDLLWALAGYGGGKLGLVVEFTMRLHQVPDGKYNYGLIGVHIKDKKHDKVLHFLKDWTDLIF